ncbi:hypothetical protein HANVADRAFT_23741 [Hanseniaspora valbyensis NRRL Y-1626]|uniref:Prephenate/arogenate dehydrogenase domain-containing protein n=1 Tax=Hanseniaspora valbyensis NRRL Y-1626 TaxID=766949 RepID=A0A1B7TEN2_9ASCO|nr:hypothetical protein HANVADRAFT_23741 [Hanseniaspora valbyensis NRRL Y-1626]
MQNKIKNYTSNYQTFNNNQEPTVFQNKNIGIIGYGAMGRLYAKILLQNQWKVNICDLPENYSTIETEIKNYDNSNNIVLFKTYLDVIKNSYFIMFCTEAHVIGKLLENIKDKTILDDKIIGGQSSSKTIEVINFLENTQELNTDIITLHSMHGPNVPTKGQSLAVMPVRLNKLINLKFVDSFTDCFESNKKFLTFMQHDKITANTQGLTHCVFINMGKAWYLMGKYPWLYDNNNTNPLEVFKVNLTFRIYGNHPHIYSNLAMMNPYSINAIKVFSKNCELINDMIIKGMSEDLFHILNTAYKNVLGDVDTESDYNAYCDNDENTHLTLLALLKTWNDCGINPIEDKALGTPIYKLLLLSVIRLFSSENLLSMAVKSTKYSEDDKQYVASVKNYDSMISNQDTNAFNESFKLVVQFFEGDDMESVKQKAQRMILELNE